MAPQIKDAALKATEVTRLVRIAFNALTPEARIELLDLPGEIQKVLRRGNWGKAADMIATDSGKTELAGQVRLATPYGLE